VSARRLAPRHLVWAAALAVLAAATWGFLAPDAAMGAVLRAIASWQLLPALSAAARMAAGGAAFSGAILALTALFGRFYCAALCPLGALQGLAAKAGGRGRKRFLKPHNAIRAVLALAVPALALAGAMGLASWIDPWSIFSRFMANDIQPLGRLLSRAGNPGLGLLEIALPAAAICLVLVLSALRGRWFCGLLCPVGSLLGLVGRFSLFAIRLDPSACVSCGACEHACPASCIDGKGKRVDASRCVNCLECLGSCPSDAIRYGRKTKAPSRDSISRSRFLGSLGGGAVALAASALPVRALASRLLPPAAETTPPGSVSISRFLDSCLACGLCVAACPSKVLQPSLGQLGLRGLFLPRLDYSVSYCQYECTACSDACPSGALLRLTPERKKLLKIGDAKLILERCIVKTKGTNCGACAEHCPTGAVRMERQGPGPAVPVFSSDICIGCGACHHICPAAPEKAIRVEGLGTQTVAKKPADDLFGAPEQDKPGSGSEGFPF
jgi:ferredoxin